MTDFLVIGGGIAGVSAAAHLAPHGSVTLLEAESTLAYHTTGRSAALFIVNYGAAGSRPLARASESFLTSPPEGLSDGPLLTPRGALWIGDNSKANSLEEIAAQGRASGSTSTVISPDDVKGLVPALRTDLLAGGVLEEDAQDIDVAGLHQAFVRAARKHGTVIERSSRVLDIRRSGRGWVVGTARGSFSADVVVNAAGAWGDEIAKMAGVKPIGLQALRRTAFMVPGSEDFSAWPMVAEVDHEFYFRPDGVQLLCSLAEETPDVPRDVKPEMEDVALAIERINRITSLDIRSVNSQWAGLRVFTSDREMVIGEDPTAPGFYWLVGLGGTGIMTAPGYGALLASLVLDTPLPDYLLAASVDPSLTLPDRFR